jgi:hypothetical protein
MLRLIVLTPAMTGAAHTIPSFLRRFILLHYDPVVAEVDVGPPRLVVGWLGLGGGGDDVRPVSDGCVVVAVARSVLAEFRSVGHERREPST